jgi:hypothetical protein
MGFYLKASELAEKTGGTFGDFTTPVSSKMREFVCTVYREFPDKFKNSKNLVRSFQRGYMASICSDLNPPPLPPPPFTGGRCAVLYKCSCQQNNSDIVLQRFVQGPIANIVCKNPSDRTYTMDVYNDAGTRIGGGSSFAVQSSVALVPKVTTENGLPDNCGNNTPSYPPTVLPPSYTKNYTIDVGGDNYDFYIKLIKDSANNLTFPITFDVNGEFNAYLDFGGFYFDVDITGNYIKNPNTKPPIVRRPPNGGGGGSDGGGDSGDGGGSGGGKPPVSNPDLLPTPLPIEQEKKEQDVERLAYITVELLSKPSNASTQSGIPGQDIYYSGWVSFSSGSFAYPRQPIHFTSNVFPAPDGANGYAVKIYKGYSAQVIKYTRKVKITT